MIIIVSIGLSAGIISQELFSILVFTVIFMTALVPSTVKWGVNWLEESGELFFTDLPVEAEAEVDSPAPMATL